MDDHDALADERTGGPSVRPLPGWAAIALVFGTSAAVLVVEILAGRLLAPYVGVSIETFTGIIGVVLAGIAVGSWAGGVAADHVDPRRLIPPLMIAGGALAIASIPIVRTIGQQGGGGGSAQIIVLTTLGFLPSATVLSAIPPAVVKLQLRDLASTGATVGRLSAWGTAGALFGTFLTGFVLVAAAAVTTLIVTVGVTLVLVGLGIWFGEVATRRRIGAAGEVGPTPDTGRTMLGLTAFAVAATAGAAAVPSPCDTQTSYYCVSIVADPDLESGRTLVLDDLRHSYVDLDDPTRLEFWYVRRLIDAIGIHVGEPSVALHIGGGALTVPRYLRATQPDVEQVVLEIDGGLVDIVRDELGLVTDDRLRVEVGDARLALDDVADDSLDVVVGDAFGARAVPFHLTTLEFVEEIDRALRPDGIYAMNLIDGPDQAFLRAQAATLQEAFDHVVVVRGDSVLAGFTGNAVVFATDEPFDVERLEQRLIAEAGAPIEDGRIVAGTALDELLAGAELLTDDFAPVDQLLTR